MIYDFEIRMNGVRIQSGKIEAQSKVAAYYLFVKKIAAKYGLMTKDEAMAQLRKDVDLPDCFNEIFPNLH